jgi:hypothetical protein
MKLGFEVKVDFGLRNIQKKPLPSDPDYPVYLFYNSGIEKLYSRMIVFALHLE